MTPEGSVKKAIKEYLDSIGAYYFMPVQTGYGTKTVDFLCCIKGRFVAIEAKAPGEVATKFQDLTITAMCKAGGIAFAADSAERVKKYVEDHVLGMYEPGAD